MQKNFLDKIKYPTLAMMKTKILKYTTLYRRN